MTDISNLKINERSNNVERLNLRKSLQLKMKIEKMKRRNSFISKGKRIDKMTGGVEYRMDEKFGNLQIFEIFDN